MHHHVGPVILQDPAPSPATDAQRQHAADHRLPRRLRRRRARRRWTRVHPALRIFTVDHDEVRAQLTGRAP